jgi:hypothetical protein
MIEPANVWERNEFGYLFMHHLVLPATELMWGAHRWGRAIPTVDMASNISRREVERKIPIQSPHSPLLYSNVSDMSRLLISLAVAAALWLLVTLIQRLRHAAQYKLPPRVPGVPIFGNSFQIPPAQQGPWAKDLAEKHGEMSLSLFPSRVCASLKLTPVLGLPANLGVPPGYF